MDNHNVSQVERTMNKHRVSLYNASLAFLERRGYGTVVHAPSRPVIPRRERAPEEVWTDAARGLLENPHTPFTQDRHSFRDN